MQPLGSFRRFQRPGPLHSLIAEWFYHLKLLFENFYLSIVLKIIVIKLRNFTKRSKNF